MTIGIESEKSEIGVIGSILLDNSVMDKVISTGLSHTHFGNSNLAFIFKNIIELKNKNVEIDTISVYEKIKNVDSRYTVSDLANLTTGGVYVSNIQQHCNIIIDTYNKRDIRERLLSVINGISSRDISDIKDDMNDIINNCNERINLDSSFLSINSDRIKNDVIVAKTGLKEIDKRIDGLHGGTLTILSGDSGTGKSTFLNQLIAENIAIGNKCMLFSGELTDIEITRWFGRTVSNECDLIKTPTKFGGYTYEPSDKAKFNIDRWAKNKLFIFNNDIDSTIDNIENAINYLSEKQGVKLFAIDNMMMISTNKEEQNLIDAEITRRLKSIARKNNIAVILVAHNKKNKDDKENVSMYDIAGSSKITNLADTIIAMKRTNEECEDGSTKVRFAISKNRTTGVLENNIMVNFNNKRKRFYEYFDNELEYDYGYNQVVEQLEVKINEV